ncbi:hypothetical protein [Candidatus Odyssella acanthamoebae]|uniref:Uncharacterized protein n=1 Tax=Candidatus Odyssella acanthamoebae TaxID=91604 RepID=A0A077AU29_9PROT|nr:hypothetical protein [Candidatus Paracaedibacter acanthamoebae]AIK95504.1 hypothetical protein ID47_00125 [Candidatus Paracaedibacter acanthamoebae]
MVTIHSKDLKLQPLAIPRGFNVIYNFFFEVLDQGRPIYFEDDPDYPFPYELYRSMLFQVLHEYYQLLVDLGWGPDGEPEGAFYITIIRADDKHWEHPLVKFSSRNKDEIVAKLNELMLAVSNGEIS